MMDVTVCVTEVGDGAHTPAPGPIRCTDMAGNMMKVLHTQLLRPICTLSSTAGDNICKHSGAGVFVNNTGVNIIGIKSRGYRPDMRILVTNPRSPKFTINLDKTPSVLGGKNEHFGSITDMIVHWEGM